MRQGRREGGQVKEAGEREEEGESRLGKGGSVRQVGRQVGKAGVLKKKNASMGKNLIL